LNTLQKGSLPFDHTGNLLVTANYTHFVVLPNDIQKTTKQLRPFLSLWSQDAQSQLCLWCILEWPHLDTYCPPPSWWVSEHFLYGQL